MTLLRRLAFIGSTLAFFAGVFAAPAVAQSTCPYIATGAVLTAAQWNSCFSAKQNSLGYVPVNKAGDVMLGKLTMIASTGSGSGLNLPQGSAPSSPNNGDLWTTIAGVFARINGVTVGPLGALSPSSFAATAPLSVTFPSSVVTYALNTDANFSVNGSSQLALASGGIAYPSSVTGGAKGAGTINATQLYVANAAVLTTNQTITLSGDISGSGTTAITTTLATVNANVGSFGGASSVPNVTVNAKGLITAAGATAVIAPAGTLSGATLASNVLASSLTSVGTLTGGATGAGFTVALSVSTLTGNLPIANLPSISASTLLANATGGSATPTAVGLGATLTFSTTLQTVAMTGDVTTSANSFATTIANNAVTNAKAAQMAAATLKGNPTVSTANATDFTIQGLTNLAAPDASLDFLIIYDHVAGTLKNVTPSAIAGSVVAGVASIDAKTGAFTTSTGITTLVNNIRLASIAADNLLMNSTGGSAAPIATAVNNCTGSVKALTYDTSAHSFGCNTFTVSNGLALSSNDFRLAAIAADSVLQNATGGSAVPTATAIPSCSTSGVSGLTYNTTTHAWGCNSLGSVTSVSITAGTGITQSGSPVTGSGSITVNVDKAANTDCWAATSNKVLTTDIAFNSCGALVSLSGTSTVTPDFGVGFNFTFTGTTATNYTLANPTNATKVGQTGCIYLIQPASGTVVTITYGSNWKTAGGVTGKALTATLGAIDRLCYLIRSSTFIDFTLANDIKT